MWKRRILYSICIIGIIWMNIIYVDRQIFLLLVLFTGIPAVSWGLLQISRRGLNIQVITKTGVIPERSEVKVTFRAVNSSPIPVYDGRLNISLRYFNDDAKDDRVIKLGASSCYKLVRTMKIEPIHCGILHITLSEMTIYDNLGMFRNKIEYKGRRNMVIMPKLFCYNDKGAVKPDPESEKYRYDYISLDNTEVMELRPYVAGDAINHIHWNLSARNDDIIVKCYGNPLERNNIIIVDLSMDKSEKFRYELDKIYGAAYSIGNLYLQQGKNTSFLAWDGKKQVERYIDFNDRESLNSAMTELMSIMCSENAGIEADRVYMRDMTEADEKPVFITMKNYVNANYRIVNVTNTSVRNAVIHIAEDIELRGGR